MLVGGPLAAIANLSSGFGAMVRFGTALFATALGLGLGTLTIAFVWSFYRPWLLPVAVLIGAAVVQPFSISASASPTSATSPIPCRLPMRSLWRFGWGGDKVASLLNCSPA